MMGFMDSHLRAFRSFVPFVLIKYLEDTIAVMGNQCLIFKHEEHEGTKHTKRFLIIVIPHKSN